jgi:hypothetical protein
MVKLGNVQEPAFCVAPNFALNLSQQTVSRKKKIALSPEDASRQTSASKVGKESRRLGPPI